MDRICDITVPQVNNTCMIILSHIGCILSRVGDVS